MLFGHQENHQPVSSAATAPQGTDVDAHANPLAVDPQTGASLPVVQPGPQGSTDNPEEQSVLNQGPAPSMDDSSSDNTSQDTPVDDSSVAVPDPSTPFSTAPAPTPEPAQEPEQVAEQIATELDTPAEQPVLETPATNTLDFASEVPSQPAFSITPDPIQAPSSDTDTPAVSAPDTDSLLSLKQQAIQQLSPLVAHLDQSPEEKFRTTMMLIQSTDNSALLQQAYEAAQAIPDEKVRAQALLDVVNEINYFTQQSNS